MRLFALLAACLFAGGVMAAPVPKAIRNKQTDADLLAGRWEIVSEDAGNQLKLNDSTMYVLIEDGRVSTGRATRAGYVYRPLQIDDSHSPKRLDVEYEPGKFVPYIYELDGDTLKWCQSQPHQARPTEFKGGGGHYCFVYKRVKDEPKKDK